MSKLPRLRALRAQLVIGNMLPYNHAALDDRLRYTPPAYQQGALLCTAMSAYSRPDYRALSKQRA